MNCVIRGLSQKMDFARDTMQTFLLVELPTGEVISALIEDAVAERVVAARVVAPKPHVVAEHQAFFGAAESVVAPTFPVDTLQQRTMTEQPDAPQEPEQESDEDGVPSV
jgi:hypothetical protein